MRKMKNKKQEKRQNKKKREKKSRKKKEKMAHRGTARDGPKIEFLKTPPRRTQKLNFYIRTVTRNRNEIEAQKKIRFRAPNKDKENERKC